MAIGPKVIYSDYPNSGNPGQDIAYPLYGQGKFDVVVKDMNGNQYYIPAVAGDVKAHTWDNGIIQTWKSYPTGNLFQLSQDYNGTVCAEFIGYLGDKLDPSHAINTLGQYSIEKIIAYDNL